MEVAGLAVGVAGLAGLFSCCNSAFQLVQRGRSFGKDYKILETKFGNQELRLRAWGRACGLIDGTQFDQRLDEPELSSQLTATLECIKLLLSDAHELKERYGLRSCSNSVKESVNNGLATRPSTLDGGPTSPGRRAALGRLLSRRSLIRRSDSTSTIRDGPSSTLATAHWIIEDREKFSELVRHLKDFIDDLEDLTKATTVPHRQLVFVEYEIESIDDIETLEEIELARVDDYDVVSDAASSRLERLSQGPASIRSPRDSGRFSFVSAESVITLESLESYFTARTRISRPGSVIEQGYFNRVAAYKAYGDQAISNRLLRLQARPRDPRELLREDHAAGKNGNTRLKCVAVGDVSSRKTELLSCFTLGGFPTAYTPIVFKEFLTECKLDRRVVDLTLWDMSGLEDYDRIRIKLYANASAVIICFLLDSVPDHDQVRHKWVPEVRQQCPGTVFIIVGIEPNASYKTSRIDITRGKRLAQEVGAEHYIQCNLEAGAGVDDVFEAAARAAMRAKSPNATRGWRFPWRTIDENTAMETLDPSFGPQRERQIENHTSPVLAVAAERLHVAPTSARGEFGRGVFITNPDDPSDSDDE